MDIKYLCLLLLCLSITLSSVPPEDEDIINLSTIPVFPDEYNHKIRAGYLNVSGYQQAFYYIFCQSQNSTKDPVILWLNGGPGCSSLIGFLTQNGPFIFNENSIDMRLNDYAWNKNANVLYLQSPGTVGFSTASAKYRTANDSSVAKDNLKALQLFFDRYDKYVQNEFYIAGQSYAGIYIPRLAQQILIYNEAAQQSTRINLKGILLGNACTHPYECYTNTYYSRFTSQFLYTRGFMDENQYKQYKTTCMTSQSSTNCVNLQKTISQNFNNSKANIYNIYAKCYTSVYPPPKQNNIFSVYQQKLHAYHQTPQGLKYTLRCTDSIGPLTLLNTNEYRAQLKIGEKNDTLFWTPCSDTLKYTMQSKATYSTLPTLVNAGLKIFYYTGDQDAMVPIQGTLYWFNKYRTDYKMPIKRSWRPWIKNIKDQNIAGMLWQLDGMSLITVKGAGHMVPSDKPAQTLQILNVFLGRTQWNFPDYYLQMTE